MLNVNLNLIHPGMCMAPVYHYYLLLGAISLRKHGSPSYYERSILNVLPFKTKIMNLSFHLYYDMYSV